MRMHGHGAHDDMSYVPSELHAEWARRDPIDRYAERLASDYGFSSDEVEEIRSEVRAYVDECAAKALASPMPDRSWRRPASSPRSSSRSATGTRPGHRCRTAATATARRRSPGGQHEWPCRGANRSASHRNTRDDLSRGDLGRAAGGDAPRRDGLLPRRGHRRLRRRVQGHGRVRRGVRRRSGASTRRSPRTRSSAPRSAPPSRGCGPSARCSSPTSSRAGSTSSSTSRPSSTTGRASPCRWWCGCRPAAASRAARSTRRTPRPGSSRRLA